MVKTMTAPRPAPPARPVDALTPDEIEVISHRRLFTTYWRASPESYWLSRLMQEMGELAGSIVGDHDDTPEHELKQIASICLNWLEMRRERGL